MAQHAVAMTWQSMCPEQPLTLAAGRRLQHVVEIQQPCAGELLPITQQDAPPPP
jgi:hypothetical protein